MGDLPRFHQLLTAPASRVLNSWFQSEPLKATLATDALIGTMSGPHTPGTGYKKYKQKNHHGLLSKMSVLLLPLHFMYILNKLPGYFRRNHIF